MTMQKYTISETDMDAAKVYITSKLHNPSWPTDDTRAQLRASRTLKAAKRTPARLTTWCETHLDTDQLAQLKNAIRAARKRTLDKSRDKPKSIVLSQQAWLILRDLARHDGTTLSATIEARLALPWRKLPEA